MCHHVISLGFGIFKFHPGMLLKHTFLHGKNFCSLLLFLNGVALLAVVQRRTQVQYFNCMMSWRYRCRTCQHFFSEMKWMTICPIVWQQTYDIQPEIVSGSSQLTLDLLNLCPLAYINCPLDHNDHNSAASSPVISWPIRCQRLSHPPLLPSRLWTGSPSLQRCNRGHTYVKGNYSLASLYA